MAQVMVNFRIDEDIKRTMEQACREMGLSMTTAFTIFASKVAKEKRIPFEITAEPSNAETSLRRRSRVEIQQDRKEELALARKQERLEHLCSEIRRSLTSLHIAIPSSITGLSMERIRLLCGDELKDKAAGISRACKALFSGRNAELLGRKDLSLLDRYTDDLSLIAEELLDIEHTLIPAMKSCRGAVPGDFAPYEQRLAALSGRFDALAPVMQQFLNSSACGSGVQAVRARLRQAAAQVETPYVRTALENLDALVIRYCDALDGQTAARLESDYLQVLELTLRELARAEQDGGETGEKAALCLRVINVLSQVLSDGGQVRQEWSRRCLEAEVEALERLAAMRGDIAGGIPSVDKGKPEA